MISNGMIGRALGVLTTEGDSVLPRGYVANPETFDFPIITEKVEGAYLDRLWARDSSIEPALIVAAERLVKGVLSQLLQIVAFFLGISLRWQQRWAFR